MASSEAALTSRSKKEFCFIAANSPSRRAERHGDAGGNAGKEDRVSEALVVLSILQDCDQMIACCRVPNRRTRQRARKSWRTTRRR